MGRQIANTFTTYELTEQEALQGAVLTLPQKQNLQNQLASVAEEKLRLSFDPEHPLKFAQEEASLKGQMDILLFLLDSSNVAEDELLNPTIITEE